jgi:hypothetical protein
LCRIHLEESRETGIPETHNKRRSLGWGCDPEPRGNQENTREKEFSEDEWKL